MSKARLSQIMSPEANPTLKTMARLFHALGEQMTVGVNSEKRVDIAPPIEPLADVWTEAHDVSISVEDAALVALVKQSVAKGVANDNHASVVIMESEFVGDTLEAA